MVSLPSKTARVLGLIFDGYRDTSSVAKIMGESRAMVYKRFLELRKLGLIVWESNSYATLRPTCRFIRAEDL